MLEKVKGSRRRGQQRTRWLDGIADSIDKSLSMLQSMGFQSVNANEQLNSKVQRKYERADDVHAKKKKKSLTFH